MRRPIEAGRPVAASGLLVAAVLPATAVLLAAALLVLSFHPPAGASAQAPAFEEGNRLYQEGDFAGAAARYESVLESGYEAAALYYNLGNARFRLGELAHAVVAYERAARLDPGNDDVRTNLALVNQQLQDRIEPLPRFWLLSALKWWIELLPRRLLEGMAAVCWTALGVAGVLLMLRRPQGWRATVRRTAWGAGLAATVLGGTLFAREAGVGRAEEAVVMVAEARVLSAPSAEGGLTVFTLHAGTKVRIDQRSGAWVEIVLADGKVGWLEMDALEVI